MCRLWFKKYSELSPQSIHVCVRSPTCFVPERAISVQLTLLTHPDRRPHPAGFSPPGVRHQITGVLGALSGPGPKPSVKYTTISGLCLRRKLCFRGGRKSVPPPASTKFTRLSGEVAARWSHWASRNRLVMNSVMGSLDSVCLCPADLMGAAGLGGG